MKYLKREYDVRKYTWQHVTTDGTRELTEFGAKGWILVETVASSDGFVLILERFVFDDQETRFK